MNLLMTRPQGASERFVARLPADLRARLRPIYAPLVEIVPLARAIELGEARGLIFTSANGVRVGAGLIQPRDLPCYCVGQATTHAAQQAGWRAQWAGNDAESLIKTLHQAPPEGPLLHLRGAHSRGNVAARLTTLGRLTRERVIYDQPLLPLTDAASQVLSGTSPVIVPLFSPRTARQFANLYTGPAPLYLVALSDAVANPVKELKYMNLSITTHPSAKSMAQLVGQLVKSAGRVAGRVEGAGSAQ